MSLMLQDLMDPRSLPDETRQVQVIRTHISIVLIADHYVYKIKKPVNFGFLDFSTLEKRKFYCQEEVRLNQRLARDIYLDILPILFDGQKHRMGKGTGETVDYAVKMRKIPDERLMLSLFRNQGLDQDHLKQIARLLADFHSQDPEGLSRIKSFGAADAFKINTDENFTQTEKYIERTITQADYKRIRQWTEDYYAQNRGIFMERQTRNKIRDCHGDLHMAHICLTNPIAIIDCIEFNERFRYTDTIADIAFLLMDLDYCGASNMADSLWRFYAELIDEIGMESLLTFYKIYRAYVRGKVIGFQLDDPQIPPGEKENALQAARKYFKLAVSYIS